MKKKNKAFVYLDDNEKKQLDQDVSKTGLSISGFFRYLWYQWRQNNKGG